MNKTSSWSRWFNRLTTHRRRTVTPLSLLPDYYLVLCDVLLEIVFTSWLGIYEFVKVDTALCNTSYRKLFCRLSKAKHFVFSFTVHNIGNYDSNYNRLKWFANKGIRFESVSISDVRWYRYKNNLRNNVYSGVQNLEIGSNLYRYDTRHLKCFYKSLKSLTIAIYNAEVIRHFRKFTQLTELEIKRSNCDGDYLMLEITKACPQLTSLGLLCDRCNVTEIKFVSSCKILKNLVKLDVRCVSITGVALYAVLSEKNTPFQKLCFSNCYRVSDELLWKVASTSAQSLTHFKLNSRELHPKNGESIYRCETTTEGIKALLNACVNLTHLDLRYQSHAVLSGETDYVRNLKLKHLCLKGCEALDDDACRSISHAYRNIDYLDLTDCFAVRGTGILTLSTHLHRLTCLNLNCERKASFVNVQVAEVVKANPLLRTLQLANRVNNLDAINTALVASRILLTEVVLSHCSELTDNDLVALSNASSELTSLNLVGCVLLTNVTLESLTEHCQKLKVLRIKDCIGFSSAGIAKCMESSKRLKEFMQYRM